MNGFCCALADIGVRTGFRQDRDTGAAHSGSSMPVKLGDLRSKTIRKQTENGCVPFGNGYVRLRLQDLLDYLGTCVSRHQSSGPGLGERFRRIG